MYPKTLVIECKAITHDRTLFLYLNIILSSKLREISKRIYTMRIDDGNSKTIAVMSHLAKL